jgi:hypothetical protein
MPGSKRDEKFPYKFERFKNLKKIKNKVINA